MPFDTLDDKHKMTILDFEFNYEFGFLLLRSSNGYITG